MISAPERLYVILSLSFGLAFLVITPPFVAPDEGAHFYRSFHVSEGHFVPDRVGDTGGGDLPLSFKTCVGFICNIPWHPENKVSRSTAADLFSAPLAPQHRKALTFMQGCSSGPAAYAPAGLAIALGRLWDDRPVMLVYWGRLGNLLAGTCLIFLAIRAAPVFKHVIMLVALLPMANSQLASLSHDAVTMSCSFLLTGLVLHSLANPQLPLRRREQAMMALAAVSLALCKMCYFPIALLCLLTPRSRFKSLLHFAMFQGATLGLSLALAYGWSAIAQDFFPDARTDSIIPCSISQQKAHILEDPLGFLGVIVRTVGQYNGLWASSFVGNLGFLDTPLSKQCVVAYLFALVLTALIDNDPRFKLGWLPRISIGCIALATIGLMLLALYLWWTPIDWPVVEGIQGRYFLPCAPLIALVLYSGVVQSTMLMPARNALLSAFCCCGLTAAVMTVTDRFYADRQMPLVVMRHIIGLDDAAAPEQSMVIALAGDWNGDGRDSPGSYDPRLGEFRLSDDSDPANMLRFLFGPRPTSYVPLAGDWDDDGIDTVGLFDPATGAVMLRNEHAGGAADITVFYGPSRVPRIPFVGDFDGDGKDAVGVYEPGRGRFLFSESLQPHLAQQRRAFAFGPADSECLPIAGDWDGDGRDTVAVYHPASATVHFADPDGAPAEVRQIRRLESSEMLMALDADGSGKDQLIVPAIARTASAQTGTAR
ncbi:MAG: DUF2142 domain-containing protein [Planctomycetes bacterium]|nr:DUF2142 domain-containing protein [Planctomycetota bacterium]